MKPGWKLGIAIPVVLLCVGATCWLTVPYFRFLVWEAYLSVRPIPSKCKQRGDEFQAKVARIRSEAKASLRRGVSKADVAHFFASESIPVDFYQVAGHYEMSGQIYVKGLAECVNIACGDDSALIGVRVDVDENGTAITDPQVVGMYTNCL